MTEKQQQKTQLGILVFHGFTATTDSVSLLVDALHRTGVLVRAPLLAGHGASSPEALRGITCTDWLTDAEKPSVNSPLHAKRLFLSVTAWALFLLLTLPCDMKAGLIPLSSPPRQ